MKRSPGVVRWVGWGVLLALVLLVGRAWSPIVWGTVAAVVLWPARVHLWSRPFARRLPHVLPLLITLLVVAGLVVPILWASWTLLDDMGTTVWTWAQTERWPSWWVTLWSLAPSQEPWPTWRATVQQLLIDHLAHANHSPELWISVLGAGANALHWLGDGVWFSATLAWWLFDGERGAQWLQDHGRRTVGNNVVNAARQALCTVRGQGVAWVVLGIVESLAMGAALHVMGLPHAWVWGGLSGLLAPVPALTPLLLAVLAVWAWTHSLPQVALWILVVGTLVFLVFDSWARPWIASQHSNLSFGWSLAGAALGLQSLGPLGLFVGPALISFAFAWLNAQPEDTPDTPDEDQGR